MNARYPAVAKRAGHRCEYCRAPEVIFNFAFEVEHVVPVSRQGADEESNLALACRACNLYKTAQLTGKDDTTQSELRLFHPREDRWDEHFAIDLDTCAIHGRTPIGRATVACLRMNPPMQVEARRQWLRLGLFP